MEGKENRMRLGVHGRIFLLYLLLLAFVALFLGGANLWLVKGVMREQVAGAKLKTVEQVAGKIGDYVDDLSYIINNFTASPQVQTLAYRLLGAQTEMERKRAEGRLTTQMSEVGNSVYTPSGVITAMRLGERFYSSWSAFEEENLRQERYREIWALEEGQQITWHVNLRDPQVLSYSSREPKPYLGAYKPMRNLYTGARYGGVLVLSPMSGLERLCHGALEESDRFVMLDRDGSAILSDGTLPEGALQKLSGWAGEETAGRWFSARLGPADYLVCTVTIPATGWCAVSLTPTSTVVGEARQVQATFLLLIGVCVLVSAAASFLLARGITQPLRQLAAAMTQVRSGQLDTSIPALSAGGEIGLLAESFGDMLESIRTLLYMQKRREKEKRVLESRFLQSQLSPHFVNNALHTVKILSRLEDWRAVNEVVSCLTTILRATLSPATEMIPLREELSILRSYLQIQYIADMQEFRYEVDTADETLDFPVPRLLLQPLIENAIAHGYDRVRRDFLIRVTARAEADGVLLTVGDNGTGMTQEKLRELLESTAPGSGRAGRVGVANVRARIALYYRSWDFQVHSAPGAGTLITIRLGPLADAADGETHREGESHDDRGAR